MPQCVFSIDLEEKTATTPSKNGSEQCRFKLSTQAGQPPHDINKIASGGELSRLSLALVLANQSNIPGLVYLFDEVDVGISGETARLLATALSNLGQKAQVICVTHLPAVAAKATHHWLVHKTNVQSNAQTNVIALTKKNRVKEIARLTDGDQVSDASLKHAEALLI